MARTGFEGSPETGGSRARDGSTARGGSGGFDPSAGGRYPAINPELGGSNARRGQHNVIGQFSSQFSSGRSGRGVIERFLGGLPGIVGRGMRATFRANRPHLGDMQRALQHNKFYHPVVHNALRGDPRGDPLGVRNRTAAGQAQGRQSEYKLPKFRNSAGKVVPAIKVARKAVGKLIYGGRLSKNQNLVVGKALRNMNAKQREGFVNSVALLRGPGKNVNVVKRNLVKPLGRAVKVAKAHRQANRRRKR